MQRRTMIMVSAAFALLMLAGCAGNSQIVKKSRKELAQMELKADAVRAQFHAGEYARAGGVFEELSSERHVSQPLYQCELATVALAQGDEEEAFRCLREAQVSLEILFDEDSERTATSLWGSESSKVYKGDAFERSTLYLMLGMMMLDRGEVGNALACFKSGLLSDADSEQDRFHSDYALLHFLSAKCHQLRGDLDLHEQSMRLAIQTFMQTHPDNLGAFEALCDAEGRNGSPASPEVLRHRLSQFYGDEVAGLATREQVIDFCQDRLTDPARARYAEAIRGDFNTLLVFWVGRAPYFERTGRYGETRLIMPGRQFMSQFSLTLNGREFDTLRGFGSLSFQATTRGGRKMDNILEKQAAFKGFTSDLGDSMFDNANSAGHPYAAAGMLAIGLVAKGISAATTVEADLRSWKTLPAEFQIVPLNLPPGTYQAQLCAYHMVTPVCTRTVSFTVEPERPVNVQHIFLHDYGHQSVREALSPATEIRHWLELVAMGETIDRDHNGEVTSAELSRITQAHQAMLDANGNGTLEPREVSAAANRAQQAFTKGMIKP